MCQIKRNILLICGIFCILPQFSNAFLFDNYRIKVKVIDDSGLPVLGADTGISFESRDGKKMTGNRGLSDSLGTFEASGSGNGYIAFGANKEGYYRSNYTYNFPQQGNGERLEKEFNILLREIVHPVPMYAGRVRKVIPFAKQEIGFDLMKADWVAPNGQGVVADFNVFLESDEAGSNDFDYNVRITFNGKYNGFYSHEENINDGSSFKLPRTAELEGYKKSIQVFWRGLKRGLKTSWNSNRHYIFRVRAEEINEKLDKALYGKIVSDLELRSNRREGKLPSIEFTYYLNPDFTTNLEFDPNRNLFSNMSDLERVTQP